MARNMKGWINTENNVMHTAQNKDELPFWQILFYYESRVRLKFLYNARIRIKVLNGRERVSRKRSDTFATAISVFKYLLGGSSEEMFLGKANQLRSGFL